VTVRSPESRVPRCSRGRGDALLGDLNAPRSEICIHDRFRVAEDDRIAVVEPEDADDSRLALTAREWTSLIVASGYTL
jgi:hypothetical protein